MTLEGIKTLLLRVCTVAGTAEDSARAISGERALVENERAVNDYVLHAHRGFRGFGKCSAVSDSFVVKHNHVSRESFGDAAPVICHDGIGC